MHKVLKNRSLYLRIHKLYTSLNVRSVKFVSAGMIRIFTFLVYQLNCIHKLHIQIFFPTL
jgi:hypothetical protein